MSLTGSCFSSESAPGALPSWDSKTRRNNLWDGLTVRGTVGPSGHTNSPHPSSREGHHSTARWSSSVLLSHLIQHGPHAAATSRVQRNSVEVKTVIGGLSPNRMNLGRASRLLAASAP